MIIHLIILLDLNYSLIFILILSNLLDLYKISDYASNATEVVYPDYFSLRLKEDIKNERTGKICCGVRNEEIGAK